MAIAENRPLTPCYFDQAKSIFDLFWTAMIHYNPVKHSLVERPSEWPWSTFHKYVRMGIYDLDWGNNGFDFSDDISYGEI